MSNNYPLITVVTATYKRFDAVFNTIRSVLEQDYPNIEYVICDDGSENFPDKEIREFLENNKTDNVKKIKVLHAVKNRGTVRNLNGAYKQSEGEYIINLSCGDVFYSKDVVRKIGEEFQKRGSSLLVTSRAVYRKNLEPVSFLPHYEDRETIMALDTPLKQYTAFITSRAYHMASGSAMCFSRKTVEKYNYFDERFVLWEDGPFLSRFLWEEKVDFAYDIIGVLYESAGVSAGHLKDMPELLIKDTYKFYSKDVFDHYDELPFSVRRKIKFNVRRVKSKKKSDKILTALLYPLETLSHVRYTKHLKEAARNDRTYIKNLL